MHEVTSGGAWFRQPALARKYGAQGWASMFLGAAAGLCFGMALKPVNPRFGFDVTPHTLSLALGGFAASVLSAYLWYRYSASREDSFNRVQKWALGMAGAWTCAAAISWNILEATTHPMPLPVFPLAPCFALLLGVFWVVGVRRWVS